MPDGSFKIFHLLPSDRSESSLFGGRGGREMEQPYRGQIKGCLVERGSRFPPFEAVVSEAGGAAPGPRQRGSQENGNVDHGLLQGFYLGPQT